MAPKEAGRENSTLRFADTVDRRDCQLLVLATIVASAQPASLSTRAEQPEIAVLEAIEHRIEAAYLESDAAFLEATLGEDFISHRTFRQRSGFTETCAPR